MEENQKNEENNQKVEYRVLKEGDRDDPHEYLASFPTGYKFCPTDEELIIHYLKPKNLDQAIPISCIKTVNLYHNTPEELTEKFKLQREQEWYFITQLISGWSTQQRQAGNGYWSTDGPEMSIYSDGQLVGYKTPWIFYIGKRRSTWRMEEYRVHTESDTSSTANVKEGDWILCIMPNKGKRNLQQEGGKMSMRIPDGVPNTGPKMQNEDPQQLPLGHHSSGLQSSSSKVSACNEYFDSLPPDGVPNTGPKMQNEDPLQLRLGHCSSGLQSSSSEVSVCDEYFDSLPPDGVPNTGPKMQNEDPLQPRLGHHSSGVQSSSSEVAACDEYFDSLPPGYRFCPTDEELIVHFLKPKNLGQPLPINRIPIADVYGSHAQFLTDTHKPLRENEWYFFTTTNLKNESMRLQKRRGVNGNWNTGRPEKEISSNGERVGFKKFHTFHKMKSAQSNNWRMFEYKCAQESAPTSTVLQVSDWLLCKVYKQEHKVETKKRRIGKGTATADAEEDEPNKEPDKVPMLRFL